MAHPVQYTRRRQQCTARADDDEKILGFFSFRSRARRNGRRRQLVVIYLRRHTTSCRSDDVFLSRLVKRTVACLVFFFLVFLRYHIFYARLKTRTRPRRVSNFHQIAGTDFFKRKNICFRPFTYISSVQRLSTVNLMDTGGITTEKRSFLTSEKTIVTQYCLKIKNIHPKSVSIHLLRWKTHERHRE